MLSKKQQVLTRKIIQSIFFLIIVYSIWKTRYPLTHYINPKLFFQFDPFVMFLTVISERILIPGLFLSVLLIILTVIFGRFFCGWICPLGSVMDIFSSLKTYIFKTINKNYKESSPLAGRFIKYGILSLMVILSIFGIQFAWLLDPITIFVRTFSYNIHPVINKAVDSFFQFLLIKTDYPLWLEDIYNSALDSFLSINTPEFPHTNDILIIFIAILLLTLIKRRFWCRFICPLGAILALAARFTPMRREVHSCYENCHTCKNICRMNAIKPDNSYLPSECTLCLDCINKCPKQDTTFTFKKDKTGNSNQ